MSKPYEDEQRALNPNRLDEERHAREEAEYRLHERRVQVNPADSDEDVAELLEAVERFEAAVEAAGGDLFVNRIGSPEPENPAFVPPQRRPGESAGDYWRRIEVAARRIRQR